MVRFPPPESHNTFCPPISRFPNTTRIPDTFLQTGRANFFHALFSQKGGQEGSGRL